MQDSPQLIRLEVHEDDRGFLSEILREDWGVFPPIKQVYIVGSPLRGTVRAWHKHEKLWDAFCIVKGRARFYCCKRRDDGTFTEPMEFILSDKCPSVLIVPPGYFHSWESLSDDCILLSIASECYNRENPDEERIPYDALEEQFGDLWRIKFR